MFVHGRDGARPVRGGGEAVATGRALNQSTGLSFAACPEDHSKPTVAASRDVVGRQPCPPAILPVNDLLSADATSRGSIHDGYSRWRRSPQQQPCRPHSVRAESCVPCQRPQSERSEGRTHRTRSNGSAWSRPEPFSKPWPWQWARTRPRERRCAIAVSFHASPSGCPGTGGCECATCHRGQRQRCRHRGRHDAVRGRPQRWRQQQQQQ